MIETSNFNNELCVELVSQYFIIFVNFFNILITFFELNFLGLLNIFLIIYLFFVIRLKLTKCFATRDFSSIWFLCIYAF